MVRKYEVFRRDGGYMSFLGLDTADKEGTVKYRGYEAFFNLSCFPNNEIDMEYKATVHDWKQAVDEELDGSKKPSKSENNSNKKENFSSEDGVTHVPASEFKKALNDIKELKANVNKTQPDKVKDMEEIMKKIEEETKKETAKLNKEVKAKENEITQLGKQMAEAQRRGDKVAQEKLSVMFDKLQTEKANIIKQKEEVVTKEELKKWLEAQNRSWFENIPWDNPWTYAKIGGALFALFVVIFLFKWLWKKYFSGNN